MISSLNMSWVLLWSANWDMVWFFFLNQGRSYIVSCLQEYVWRRWLEILVWRSSTLQCWDVRMAILVCGYSWSARDSSRMLKRKIYWNSQNYICKEFQRHYCWREAQEISQDSESSRGVTFCHKVYTNFYLTLCKVIIVSYQSRKQLRYCEETVLWMIPTLIVLTNIHMFWGTVASRSVAIGGKCWISKSNVWLSRSLPSAPLSIWVVTW